MTELVSSHPADWPHWLVQEMRSNHAGEAGAVMIYRGILAVSRDPEVRAFAEHHLHTEQSHLELIEALPDYTQRTRLLRIWRLLGWVTGALPALFGRHWVFATIDAVETFVDHHYQSQLDRLMDHPELAGLRADLARCQEDEIAHRDEARALAGPVRSTPLRAWCWMVATGSASAVNAARRL